MSVGGETLQTKRERENSIVRYEVCIVRYEVCIVRYEVCTVRVSCNNLAILVLSLVVRNQELTLICRYYARLLIVSLTVDILWGVDLVAVVQ